MSCSFTNQVLAQMELHANEGRTASTCTRCPSTSTSRWPGCTSAARRQAHRADRRAGRLPRRPAGRPVQARPLPVLSRCGRIRCRRRLEWARRRSPAPDRPAAAAGGSCEFLECRDGRRAVRRHAGPSPCPGRARALGAAAAYRRGARRPSPAVALDAARPPRRPPPSATRPTAVNLAWGVRQVVDAVAAATAPLAAAHRIAADDVAASARLGAHGAALVPDGRPGPDALQRRQPGHRRLRHGARRDPRRPRRRARDPRVGRRDPARPPGRPAHRLGARPPRASRPRSWPTCMAGSLHGDAATSTA